MAKFPPDDDDDIPGGLQPPAPLELPPSDQEGPSMNLTDEQAERQIGRRTSWVGRIAFLAIILLVAGLGYMLYVQTDTEAHKWDEYRVLQGEPSAGGATDQRDFLTKALPILARNTDEEVRETILMKLREYRDREAQVVEGSVAQVIPMLDDRSPRVRREAALLLAAIGSPAADSAKPKLLERLAVADERDKPQIVWALTVLRETAASDAILDAFSHGLLQGQPGFDPKTITDALGIEKLATLTEFSTTPPAAGNAVRTLVAQALAEAGNAQAVQPLIALLDDSEPEVVRAAAVGLGRTGDPSGARPLFELLGRRPELRNSILDAVKKSTGAQDLSGLLAAATDTAIKRDLVRLLRASHDPAGADALVTQLTSEDGETKLEAAVGLAEVGDVRALETLLTIAGGTDESDAHDALVALRWLSIGDQVARVGALLEQFPGRKADCLRVLGRSGNQAAGPFILAEVHVVADPEDIADSTESALVALGELHYEPAYRQVLGMTTRPRDVDFSQPSVANETIYRNRLKAIETLGLYGKPDADDALLAIVRDADDDERIREAAGRALGFIAPPETLTQMLAQVKDTSGDATVRRYLVQALWVRPNRDFARELLGLIGAEPPEVSRAAALAVGYAGDEANDAQLLTLLDGRASRRDAAIAIILGGSEAGAQKLLSILPGDSDLRDSLDFVLNGNDTDEYAFITQQGFESGQVWRRLKVAQILQEESPDYRFGTPWGLALDRLKNGWAGPGGIAPHEIRAKLYEALTGTDAGRRQLAADILGEMGERGLLMKARDAGQGGAREAREKLNLMNNPGASS